MKLHTLTLKFIPYHRINVAKIKELGFKEWPRAPRRIRSCKQDDFRTFKMEVPMHQIRSKFSEIKDEMESIGYTPDDILIFAKTPVGLLRMEEIEYTVALWK